MAIIIETKPAAQKNCQAKACRVEQLTLDWEDRRKPRQRVVTDQGTEVVLALPRGTVLAEGDCLYQDDDLTIEVHAKAQMVLKITPANLVESCRVAHHLGNWHRSIEVLADGSLTTQQDQPFEEWLKREAIRYESVELPFHPNLSGAEH